ncbi:WhiB family transcriptional regulator [Streptomyces sp. Lzd4kr]|nr:WhiB family transcriptional regulator [Streptomyces sp. Lzd4kr]
MSHYGGSIPDTITHTRDWQTSAACKGMGERSEIFFASDTNRPLITEARTICGSCPARTACLTAAFQEGDEWGMRGGLTRRQRLHYLRKNGHDVERAIAETTGNVTAIIRRVYRHHTQPTDGHVVWTDKRTLIPVLGEQYTVHRLAWWAHHGRPPVGSVKRACRVEGCVAKACLTDRPMREQAAAAVRKKAAA